MDLTVDTTAQLPELVPNGDPQVLPDPRNDILPRNGLPPIPEPGPSFIPPALESPVNESGASITISFPNLGANFAAGLVDHVVEAIFGRAARGSNLEDIDGLRERATAWLVNNPNFQRVIGKINDGLRAVGSDVTQLDGVLGFEVSLPVDQVSALFSARDDSALSRKEQFDTIINRTSIGVTFNPSGLFAEGTQNAVLAQRATEIAEGFALGAGLLAGGSQFDEALNYFAGNATRLAGPNDGSAGGSLRGYNILKLEVAIGAFGNEVSFPEKFKLVLIDVNPIVKGNFGTRGQDENPGASDLQFVSTGINVVEFANIGNGLVRVNSVVGLPDVFAAVITPDRIPLVGTEGVEVVYAHISDYNLVVSDQNVLDTIKSRENENGETVYGRILTNRRTGEKLFVDLEPGELDFLTSVLEFNPADIRPDTDGLRAVKLDELRETSNLNEIGQYVVRNLDNPIFATVADSASLIGAILTANPYVIAGATYNFANSTTDNFFQASYNEIVETTGFSADSYILAHMQQFVEISKAIEETNEDFSRRVSDAFFTETKDELREEWGAVIGRLLTQSELQIESIQGFINQAVERGDLKALDIYQALEPYIEGQITIESRRADGEVHNVDPDLYSSVARRLLGDRNPLVFNEDNSTNFVYQGVIANIVFAFADTERPPELRILLETKGLTDLTNFDIGSLGNIENTGSLRQLVGGLISNNVDPFAIYEQLDPDQAEQLGRDVPGLDVVAAFDKAFDTSVRALQNPDHRVLGADNLFDVVNGFAGTDLGLGSVAELRQALAAYRAVLTGDVSLPVGVAGQFNLPVSAAEAERRYAALINEVALNLTEAGFAGTTGITELDARLTYYVAFRDGGQDANALANDTSLTDGEVNRILEGRDFLRGSGGEPRQLDGFLNIQWQAGAFGQDAFTSPLADFQPGTVVAGNGVASRQEPIELSTDGDIAAGDRPETSTPNLVAEILLAAARAYEDIDPTTVEGQRQLSANDLALSDLIRLNPNLSREDANRLLEFFFVGGADGDLDILRQDLRGKSSEEFLELVEGGSTILGAQSNAAELRNTLTERGGLSDAQVDRLVADQFDVDLAVLEGGTTISAYAEGQFTSLRPADRQGLDRDAFVSIITAIAEPLIRNIVPAQTGDAEARAALEAAGVTFDENGIIVSDRGSAVLEVLGIVGENPVLRDPSLNAAVAALGENATPDQINDAISGLTSGAESSAFLEDIGALRGQVSEQIGQLETLGGNAAAITFLRSFDLALGAVELTGAEFSGSAISQFLSSGAGSIGFFLDKISAGDAAAWSAFAADLGAFGTSLTDGQSQVFLEQAYGLSLAGSFLTLTGSSATDPNTALVVSGELLTIISDGLLAAAGTVPAGFQSVTTPEFAIGAGFGRLLGRFADGTETVADDIGAVLLEQGLPAWEAFRTGDIPGELGEVIDGRLVGSAILASAGGSILGEVIDGEAGRIIAAVGEGASTGLSLAAGTINPAQAAISGLTQLFQAIGVPVPPEVQTGALVALAAVNASNPVGWAALAVQLVFQLASLRSFTTVTDIATAIDADGDLALDDVGQLSTDYHTTFWGRTRTDDGRLQYEVNSPNGLRLENATFDLQSAAEVSLVVRVPNPREYGPRATLTINGEEHRGEIRVGNREVNSNGFYRSGEDSTLVTSAEFVSTDGTIRVPVTIDGHGNNNFYNSDGAEFRLTEDAAASLPEQYRVTVSGRYDGINPSTEGEDFNQRIELTAEQYEALRSELGGDGVTTLNGDNALFDPVDDPATPANEGTTTAVQQVLSQLTVTFQGAERDPNLYQYIDMNGDGYADLVRYGIRQNDDGLNSGDQLYEVTLLGPNLTDLGLPTIKSRDINEAAEVASLVPYLFQWAATRPEVALHGNDPVSLYLQASESGDLPALIEIRDVDLALSRDVALLGQALAPGTAITTQQWEGLRDQVATNPDSVARRSELNEALNLFDPAAYAAENADVAAAFGDDGVRITYHYLTHGNGEGRVIDASGTVLADAPDAIWPDFQSAGYELQAGERLYKGQTILSENGDFALLFHDDGALKLYDLRGESPVVTWEAERSGNTDDGWLEIGADGNLVLHDDDGEAEWSSNTFNSDVSRDSFTLTVEDDGNLTLNDTATHEVLWSSETGKRLDPSVFILPDNFQVTIQDTDGSGEGLVTIQGRTYDAFVEPADLESYLRTGEGRVVVEGRVIQASRQDAAV
jgi:hypothetical protein